MLRVMFSPRSLWLASQSDCNVRIFEFPFYTMNHSNEPEKLFSVYFGALGCGNHRFDFLRRTPCRQMQCPAACTMQLCVMIIRGVVLDDDNSS